MRDRSRIIPLMNKLTTAKRTQIVKALVEGNSLRSTSRMVGVSINTVTKLLVDAGMACATFHDEMVRNVTAKRVQCDEIWNFCYAKEKNVRGSKAAPDGAGGAQSGASGVVFNSETTLVSRSHPLIARRHAQAREHSHARNRDRADLLRHSFLPLARSSIALRELLCILIPTAPHERKLCDAGGKLSLFETDAHRCSRR